ncbi:MAG: hypothetical protein SGI71_10545 [Verrucomicrobiota bacterium]|nr:hypothetical protein [Verrucomicrobiota bacterium]
MKIRILQLALIASIIPMVGCTTVPSVGSYGTGSDSAFVNDARGRPESVTSRDQLANAERSRRNVHGELELDKAKREDFVDRVRTPLKVLDGFRGNVRW